jgi:hypothetical protein
MEINNLFKYIVLIQEISIDDEKLIMRVLSVENKGASELLYNLIFTDVRKFELNKIPTQGRGLEVDVDVDDIIVNIDNDENEIVFDSLNFDLKIKFKNIIKVLIE